MVGSALVRALQARGYQKLLTPTRHVLDCLQQQAVATYLQEHRPDIVVIAAAKVGGIVANASFPADFLYENLMIAANLIHGAHLAGVSRLLFLGSTCIYPRHAPQPISEDALLSAPLEATNEAYAVAKICGVKLCQYYQQQHGRNYISAMPTNLYGPGDRYHLEYSHVIPALMMRFHEAKLEQAPSVTVWGTGRALREFLYVDDLAQACLFLLQSYHNPMPINIGSHEEVSIAQLAQMIADTVGYKGSITYDTSRPDGTPRKKTDISKITQLGWRPTTTLKEGLSLTYQDFLECRIIAPAFVKCL